MRNEVSETYNTHPCSSGFATWVADTRTQTQNPNTCKRKTREGEVICMCGVVFLCGVSLLLCLWLKALRVKLGGN